MHAVLTTPTFMMQAKRAGLSEQELQEIEAIIAADPQAGDRIAGTGGARKLRFAGRGHGKSGGYRTIHYYAADDVPVFLLAIYGKDEKANLTLAERNELSRVLPLLATQYRARH